MADGFGPLRSLGETQLLWWLGLIGLLISSGFCIFALGRGQQ